MAKFYVCQKCKAYYDEDDYAKLILFKLKPRTRICKNCGAEMTHDTCYRQEFYY